MQEQSYQERRAELLEKERLERIRKSKTKKVLGLYVSELWLDRLDRLVSDSLLASGYRPKGGDRTRYIEKLVQQEYSRQYVKPPTPKE